MQKQQVIGLFVLLAVTAAVIGTVQLLPPEQTKTPPEAEDAYEEFPPMVVLRFGQRGEATSMSAAL